MAIENDHNPIIFLPEVAAQGCGCVTIILVGSILGLISIGATLLYAY